MARLRTTPDGARRRGGGEGTTTNGANVIAMQKGAFRPGHPVRALAFRCPFGHTGFNPAWGARDEGGDHLLGLMAQVTHSLKLL